MKQKLLLLDIALAAVAIAAGFQFRSQWKQNKAREQAKVHVPLKPAAVPPLTPIPKQPDVVPVNYFKIAEKMLFDPSRNSTVAPPPPPPPPPPKPMPPLPVFHGMMNIGTGNIAILSLNSGSPHQPVRPGDAFGQFTIVDVNSNGITFEWEGQRVYKDAEELSDRANGAAAQNQQVGDSRPAAPPPGAAPPPPPPKPGPGEMTQFGSRICRLDDGVAEGAIVDGFRKVVYINPFGRSCGYERAQ
jgi:hypothetical protein